jgi:hypothetical protein
LRDRLRRYLLVSVGTIFRTDIAYEGARCRVVAAHARVDVAEELAPLGDRHTPLQDA